MNKKYLSKESALKKAGYVPKMGRPEIGNEWVTAMKIPAELKKRITLAAKSAGESLPNWRREAYEEKLKRQTN